MTIAFNQLRVRPTRFDDEPAFGYMLRWAHQAGWMSGRSFARHLGLDFDAVYTGKAHRAVAEAAGLCSDAFEKNTIVTRSGEGAQLGSHELPLFDVNMHRFTVCPECLKEDLAVSPRPGERTPHTRAWWDLVHVAACPFHGIRLVDVDGGRKTKYSSYALDLELCFRGDYGKGFLGMPCERVSDTIAERYVLGRLGFAEAVDAPLLDSLPLLAATRAMDRFGAVAVGGRKADTYSGKVDKNAAMNAGFRVSRDFECFGTFLDDLVARSPRKQKTWGTVDAYGNAYMFLNERRDQPCYAELIETMREHALANLPLSPEIPLFGESIGERRLYTLRHVYKKSGIHWDKAEKLLKITGHIPPYADRDAVLPQDRALDALSTIEDSMNFNQAMKFLGLSRSCMIILLRDGVLVPRYRAGSGELKEHVFMRPDLERLVRKVRGKAKAVDPLPDHLTDIARTARLTSTHVSKIVRFAIEGSVPVEALDAGKPGLGAVLLDRAKVKECMPKRSDEFLTMTEMMPVLGVCHHVATQLVDKGYIPAVDYDDPGLKRGRTTYVERKSVERFAGRYAKAQEVARLLGTHVRTLVPKLWREGIRPAIERSDVGETFYRRCDCERLSSKMAKGSR